MPDLSSREPEFAEDFYWWIQTYGNNPPPECLNKYVLLYNRKIIFMSENQSEVLAKVIELQLENKHYAVMTVGVKFERETMKSYSIIIRGGFSAIVN